MKKKYFKIFVLFILLALVALTAAACEFNDDNKENQAKFYINDNAYNKTLKNTATKSDAIDNVDEGITNLREYLNQSSIATTGYYMGVEFNINTLNPETLKGGNFRLKIQAHLYTYPYEDEDGNPIYKYYDKRTGTYFDEQNEEGTRILTKAEDIHNEAIKKSDILIEWYDGVTNQMLIGVYYDGINNNSEDPGNILYLNIQGAKRYFVDFGDTVLYRQMIRLLTSLSVESLLVSGNIQDDAGVSTIRKLFEIAVNDNYKVVLNDPITSTLFYNIAGDALAPTLTSFYQGLFAPFGNKIDPLTKKYLGFKFSTMAYAKTNTVNSDMQFFTQLNNEGTSEIMTGAYLTFDGTATSAGELYDYISDISFEYGAYPPEDMKLDKKYYRLFENGRYEFVGNLYIPMLNSNYDALIRTDMNRFDNSTNNVFMEFRDIANGELMIGTYYKNELTYLDISGLEYLYGAIALDELGFPKVYDDSLDLAKALSSFAEITDNMIISIVDGILSPDKNDKENHLLEYIMEKTESTEKDPKDIFSKNTVTLTVDMELIKHVMEETGNGTYTTRQIINILDSFSPYSMDQIATILGVASAEVMLDKTYFTICLNVDTNEITIKMFTDVGVEIGQPSTMIFQLDILPTHFGEYVDIANVNFDNFKPLEQIYTYSATMEGNFMFSTAEVVDLSYLLGATIGDSSGKNTVYQLDEESGVSFKLTYDQFVLDQTIDGILHRGGRSSFDLEVWITGHETKILIRLASDDVAFNNKVYDKLPESEPDLGYVWVDIQCIYEKDGTTRRIPKVKIREDVFMSSMQAYMNNTSIADDATKLGQSDLNLSITTILFALMEDSYVVAQPEKIEITTSNETVQNLFRVKSLIGNIKTDAGFRARVTGLASIKQDYALYKVGQFEDMEAYSPYSEDAILHDNLPVYFYKDYHDEYDPFKYEFRVCADNRLQVYYEGKYYDPFDGAYYYEQRYITQTAIVDGIETEVKVPQRTKVSSGVEKITRETIEYGSDNFFTKQGPENQDITKIRFNYSKLKDLIFADDGKYYYFNYDDERVDIEDRYIKIEGENRDKIYIYWLGIKEIVYYENNATYYYYNRNLALTDTESGRYVYIENATLRNYLFDYDKKSIAITNEAKTQYAPRTEGSFMGEVRRYYLLITSPYPVERSLVIHLNNFTYYCEEDEFNIVEIFNDDGVKISEELVPIPLYIMEPAEPLWDDVETVVAVGSGEEIYTHSALWNIDWESVTLRGYMVITTVTVAPGTMGEDSFPVRIIVSNREIIPSTAGHSYVDLYNENSEIKAENVPVVDNIEIDPYDYILAKYEYFMDISNFNPTQYSAAEFNEKLKQAETAFRHKYFEKYIFSMTFNAENSILRAEGVKEQYIYKSYTNILTDNTMDFYDWYLDQYEGSTQNIERNINPDGGVVYLHTYFKGQLIALRVEIGKRKFDRLKFSETDNYRSKTVDGVEINGHYMANYYDTSSFVVPTTPIFIFIDEYGREYEKVFDFDYVSGLDARGNYIVKDFGVSWSDKTITNIGSMGSYFISEYRRLTQEPQSWQTEYGKYFTRSGAGSEAEPYVYTPIQDYTPFEEGEFYEAIVLNRPFYISNVIRNENGQVISEKPPTPTGNNSDIDTSSLNLRHTLCLYKYDESNKMVPIPMISGTDNDEWFREIVLRAKVECPQLDVDNIGVSEYDEINEILFTPTALSIGSMPVGYYQIDPLNAGTRTMPTALRIYFKDKDGNRISSHMFTGIEWENYDKEVILYDSETQTYQFCLSTDNPMTTQIKARVGSAVSGYQDIVLCIKVLSKDPQKVEFYTGNTSDEKNKIDKIEEISVNIGDIAQGDGASYTVESGKGYVSYAYYVDTFANFILPKYLKATFGTSNNQRTEVYAANWKLINSNENPAYRPNSVVNLVTIIGDGEVIIKIYLAVVVENYTISRIDLNSNLQNYYVKVGDNINYTYQTLLSLYQRGILSQNKLGFYSVVEDKENYIVISTGCQEDEGVEMGKIGLYLMRGEEYELQEQMYPYDFINEIYSGMDIIFNPAQQVNLWNFDYAYSDIYVYLNDGMGNQISKKLKDVTILKYIYDFGSLKDTISVNFMYNDGLSNYYLEIGSDGIVYLYPDTNMTPGTEKATSLQALTNALILMEISSDNLINATINEAYSIKNENTEYVDFGGKTVANSYGYARGVYTFYDKNNNPVMFQYITVEGFGTMRYEEFLYRLNYYRNHRATGYTPTKISGKTTYIENMEGIFNVNDVVLPLTEIFHESTDYKIGIGTGKGSYDLTLRLIFSGGLRSGVSADTVVVYAYNANGYAQYGDYGYVLSTEITTSITAIKQDITLTNQTYYYGYNNGEKLIHWYVEGSEYEEIAIGSMITFIPQSVVYANSDGTLTLSAMTSQGFRIRRTFEFKGVPDDISNYDSINSALEIINGVIYIKNIYNYYPLTNYFSTSSNLPSTVEITTDDQVLRVSGIDWKISEAWNDGRNGNLYDMTYMGTYNETMQESSNTKIAEAEILGWTSIKNGKSVQNNTIKIQLFINIDSAKVVSLPWADKNPKLETMTIKEDDKTIFAIDVDAFADSASSAISGQNFIPPASIIVKYSSGITHTFANVSYSFRNISVNSIPYSIEGINTASLAATLNLAQGYFNKQYIDLQVNLGLGQEITLRFRFYDKTIENISAVISLSDEDIRKKIKTAMVKASERKEELLIEMFNLTRIEYNLGNLIYQAKQIREKMTIPQASDLSGDASSADILRNKLKAAFDGIPDVETVSYPETIPYEMDACWNYAYNVMREYINNDSNLTYYVNNIQKYKSSHTKIAEFVNAFYSNMLIKCYETIIYNYIESELLRVLKTQTYNIGAEKLNYAISYKNTLESLIDVEKIIKSIYRIKELNACGIYSTEQTNDAAREVFINAINQAITAAQRATSNNAVMSEIINSIFKTQIGLMPSYGLYRPLNGYTVNDFIGNSMNQTKVEMRAIINSIINKCMDFTLTSGENKILSEEMKEALELAIKQSYANTANLAKDIAAVRSNITTGISSTTAIDTLFKRIIRNYVDKIFMESKIGCEIKRIQKEGVRTDSYYILDPYGDYLYVPTKLVADFNEEYGGFSFSFNITWSNDYISNNVSYQGNAQSDEYALIEMWAEIYNRYATINVPREKMDELFNSLKPQSSWENIKADNQHIYNILMNIETNLVNTFATYNFYAPDAPVEEKALILYNYYLAGQNLHYKAVNEAPAINITWGMNSEEILRCFEEFKYHTLIGNLYLSTTHQNQDLRMVVKVLDRTIDKGDIEIRHKDTGDRVYTEFVVENPFTTTINDLPNIVNINGTDYEIIWNNVSISPTGNLNSANRIDGNIKNSSGQSVSMYLIINKWSYTAMRRRTGTSNGEDVFTYMNSNGFLNFYFNEYQEYSSEDYYQIVFNVSSLDNQGKTVTESQNVIFYPENSRLLINTTYDDQMAEVKARKNYILYWDSNAMQKIIQEPQVGNVYLGNAIVGNFNLTRLADPSVNGVVTRGKYFYENIDIEKIQLIMIDSKEPYYWDVKDYIMAREGEATLITDAYSTLPMTGEVVLSDSNINYEFSKIKVRFIWNTPYETVINKLEDFVKEAFPDVETPNLKAKSILLNIERTETEEEELLKKAIEYVKKHNQCGHLGSHCPECEKAACQLLCIREKYEFNNNASFLSGGINGNQSVTVILQIGKSATLYTKRITVKVVFSDFAPKGNYILTDPYGDENDPANYTLLNTVEQGALPSTVYVAVRSDYWNDAQNKNSYAAENIISPYNTNDNYIFKLLDNHNRILDGKPHVAGMNLIKVTDIVYGESSYGQISSTSFVIDGVRYESNLIRFALQ